MWTCMGYACVLINSSLHREQSTVLLHEQGPGSGLSGKNGLNKRSLDTRSRRFDAEGEVCSATTIQQIRNFNSLFNIDSSRSLIANSIIKPILGIKVCPGVLR